MADFPSLLRQHRTAAGLSQSVLTTMVGCDQTYISLLERGKRQPSRKMVLTLSEALGLGQSDTDRLLFSANYAPQTDYQSAYEAEHGAVDAGKWCWGCQAMLPLARFAISRSRYDGRQSACRLCGSARRKKYRTRVALRGQARRAS